MKFVRNAIYASVFFYVCLIAFYFGMQRSFLYFPDKPYATLEELEIEDTFKEISYKTEDNIDLKGWYAPATKKQLTIVYFHGNADSLKSVYSIALPYIQDGYGFFLAEYRGYSGLSGKPTENGLYADGRAAIMKLFDLGVDVSNIIPMGHSLGTGVATQMAVEYHSPALILVAPFRSIVQVAQERYPFFPTSLLVLDRYDNEQKIKRVIGSVIILHGDADAVIPYEQGQRLFDRSNDPKEFHLIPGRGHSDLFDDSLPFVLPWLDALVTAH